MPGGKELIFASGSKTLAAYFWRISVSGSGQPRTLPFALESGAVDSAVALKGNRLVYTIFSATMTSGGLTFPRWG